MKSLQDYRVYYNPQISTIPQHIGRTVLHPTKDLDVCVVKVPTSYVEEPSIQIETAIHSFIPNEGQALVLYGKIECRR